MKPANPSGVIAWLRLTWSQEAVPTLGITAPTIKRRIPRPDDYPLKARTTWPLKSSKLFQPKKDERVYVLMDSWYTSEKVINACNRRGFHIIAAVKTNRRIHPAGVSLPLDDFAERYIR